MIIMVLIKPTLRQQNQILQKIYYDPKNPAGFGSPKNIYNETRVKGFKISLQTIKRWLSKQDAYTLHKQRRYNFSRRKTISRGISYQFQVDIVDLSQLSRENNNYKYLLTAIDIFSRFSYAVPLKTKTGQEVKEALSKIILPNKIAILQTDDGGEFLNKTVQDFLKQHKIHFFTTSSDKKCAIIERWNRTLKSRMFKYFTAKNTLRYIDKLSDLVKSYNSRYHRAIGTSPSNVNKQNEKEIWERQYGSFLRSRKAKYRFKIHDKVRLTNIKESFRKGYLPTFTQETFRIIQRINTSPPTYFVIDNNNEILKGSFYEPELQLVL